MDFESYVQFLLEHHRELNLPYPFAVKLSFVSSPLVAGKAMLIFSEEPYEIVGAAGFVIGTGANQYEDKHVCQIETVFIRQEYRVASLFWQSMRALVELMKQENPAVRQVQFWASADHKEQESLFRKFASLPGASRTVVEGLALYQVPYSELEAYLAWI
ncbi:hypothetical protein JFN88_03305 [Paenibacillus sp. MAHUQ-46]|uniref:Uncharacterized protein n=2 Tax=Paenibacillus TaxID=44249 RepID=A0A934J2G3_9BACL|nr:hypothetical protein [Paenibacillus roseus]MBJ6360349.1 hypothetical protein [Paenibacillus roseus]